MRYVESNFKIIFYNESYKYHICVYLFYEWSCCEFEPLYKINKTIFLEQITMTTNNQTIYEPMSMINHQLRTKIKKVLEQTYQDNVLSNSV